jgi:glycyl-tRNA synthetase
MLPEKLKNFNRNEFEDTCRRKFFFDKSFDIYGGVSGLYDYGPILCSIKNNFLQEWRKHFILEENMCEIECTCTTPEEVFIHSGHVDRFNDIMCKDVKTGECFRLDKHIESFLENLLEKNGENKEMKQELIDVGSMSIIAMNQLVEKYNIKSPKGNDLSDPFPFNLMFSTTIGPDGSKVGYLRPELAQGIFMNFKRIMDTANAKEIPFAIASIGQAFRNEIAPRNSLLRVREFTLAEIEHFVNPNNKNHCKFQEIKDVQIFAWNRDLQSTGKEPELRTLEYLVENKIIDNETLGYFIARTQLFLQNIGMKYVRFRQHRKDEMAHYAQDCWDAECLSSYGWIECVGIADRSAYDLTQHMNGSTKDLFVREELQDPITIKKRKLVLNKDLLKEKYPKYFGRILQDFKNKTLEEEEKLETLNICYTDKNGEITECIITPEMYDIICEMEKQTFRKYIPNVIEPSFGVGRILYCMLEQNYTVQNEDEKRSVFSIVPTLAHRQVGVISLTQNLKFEDTLKNICNKLKKNNITFITDNSGVSIGKKYARFDEIGIPYCITCDFDTIEKDNCVTIRNRDTRLQKRVKIENICDYIYE